ncbi:hypothetical protein Salat_2400500 [Sesamum alatum]|uniref:Uncharacterized protein n=1 Tax=Sesamum alatum TaxID=300844 RepID=A0AAE1XXH7_9LAMI|nr:hypothetical protein Salat_2400500 [Sesamum alatum]
MNDSELSENALCYPLDRRPFKGMFFGDSPFSFDTPRLLFQLSICALLTAVMQVLLMPLGQSVFISQVLTSTAMQAARLAMLHLTNPFQEQSFDRLFYRSIKR